VGASVYFCDGSAVDFDGVEAVSVDGGNYVFYLRLEFRDTALVSHRDLFPLSLVDAIEALTLRIAVDAVFPVVFTGGIPPKAR
jgi:hypothetical protein